MVRPLLRVWIRHIPVDDPWEAVTSAFVTPRLFGPGSLRMFRWYFEGESVVHVHTLDDLCGWLAECQYLSDDQLFNEADFWQHPRTFENLRKGDCEDHALWAWRKLVEMGYRAEFFVGEWFTDGDDAGHHAWVVFERDEQRFVLEAIMKSEAAMIRPLLEVHREYVPHFSVDAAFSMRSHAGYLLYLKRRERRARHQAA